MATEYTFKTTGSGPAADVVSQLAGMLSCELVTETFARRSGLHVTGSDSSPADVTTVEHPDLLGRGPVASVTFRFLDHQVPDETSQANFRDMVTTVIRFLTGPPTAAGLLLFNGETIVLQRLPGGQITFDDEWSQYAPDEDDPRLAEISAGYPGYRLPQPLL